MIIGLGCTRKTAAGNPIAELEKLGCAPSTSDARAAISSSGIPTFIVDPGMKS